MNFSIAIELIRWLSHYNLSKMIVFHAFLNAVHSMMINLMKNVSSFEVQCVHSIKISSHKQCFLSIRIAFFSYHGIHFSFSTWKWFINIKTKNYRGFDFIKIDFVSTNDSVYHLLNQSPFKIIYSYW